MVGFSEFGAVAVYQQLPKQTAVSFQLGFNLGGDELLDNVEIVEVLLGVEHVFDLYDYVGVLVVGEQVLQRLEVECHGHGTLVEVYGHQRQLLRGPPNECYDVSVETVLVFSLH